AKHRRQTRRPRRRRLTPPPSENDQKSKHTKFLLRSTQKKGDVCNDKIPMASHRPKKLYPNRINQYINYAKCTRLDEIISTHYRRIRLLIISHVVWRNAIFCPYKRSHRFGTPSKIRYRDSRFL